MAHKTDSTEPAVPALDLNLIRLYVAIFETGSVSGAAERLSMTQPSVSYGLARLRRELGDALFTRSGRGVAPTPMSERLYAQCRDALTLLENAVQATHSFDPKTSQRTFRVAMSDVGAICLAPPLQERLRESAPQATLEIAQVPVKDVVEALAFGKLDVAVGNLPMAATVARSELLFVERYVCLVSSSHPRVGATISAAQFIAERHIVINSPYSLHQHIEESLIERGVRRRAALRLPHYGILPAMLSKNDYLVTLPSRLGAVFERLGGVRCIEIPVELPSFEVRAVWHARQQSNPGNAWLRQTIIESLHDL
jgi:DNA-binding transcriptional LysR family regulator